MSLRRATGNMYDWVTHTHNHLGGECPHECIYCYIDNPRFGRPAKYQGNIILIEEEFHVKYGKDKIIFVENCSDICANGVPQDFRIKILSHCCEWPQNVYIFQSKNPGGFLSIDDSVFPPHYLLGTTIESNRVIEGIGHAPRPYDRMVAMCKIKGRKFVTIEPVLDFDVDILAEWIARIRPEFTNLGADSKNHNLPEPSVEKINALVDKLYGYGIELRVKHNLGRLRP